MPRRLSPFRRHVHSVRVRSPAVLVFKLKPEGDEGSNGNKSFLSKVIAGSKQDHSLFAWADKGQWETARLADEEERRDANWFRIGFEPLFADFTQTGSWFVVYTLVEVNMRQRKTNQDGFLSLTFWLVCIVLVGVAA